jgi:hypothetical protein
MASVIGGFRRESQDVANSEHFGFVTKYIAALDWRFHFIDSGGSEPASQMSRCGKLPTPCRPAAKIAANPDHCRHAARRFDYLKLEFQTISGP